MYKIVRFTFDENHPDNHRVIKTGLTLEEAQEHCQRDDTREKGVWFDGYDEEQTMSNKVNMAYWDLDLIDGLLKDGTLEEDPRPYDHHVNLYEVDRSYGGPEEGGWYYDTGTLVSDELFPDLASGIARAEEIKSELLEEDPLPYKMGMGANDGLDPSGEGDDNYLIRGGSWGRGSYLIRVERKTGKDYPEYRPHWE